MDTALISAPVYAFGLILTVFATNWIARKRHERRVMRMLRRMNQASSPAGVAPNLPVDQKAQQREKHMTLHDALAALGGLMVLIGIKWFRSERKRV